METGKEDAVLALKEKIHLLEEKRAGRMIDLKIQFKKTIENLKPINLIEDVFSSTIKNNVLVSAIGITSGYLTKKAIVGSSKNPFLKLLGALAGRGIANIMSKHPEEVRSIGAKFFHSLLGKKDEPLIENQHDH